MVPAAQPGPLAAAVVLVGAGPGLGSALARRFAREGYRPVLLARQPQRLDLSGLSTPAGDAALTVAADVTDRDSLVAAFDQVHALVGDPQVLVYNVSMFVAGPPTKIVYTDFVQGLLAGVAGALVAVQQVVPAMRAAGTGTVLVTGSGVATEASVSAAGLAVQKAGVRSLALSLAEELRPAGVHAATVTIRGTIAAGTAFDPDRIADAFWALHRQSAGDPATWQREVEFTG
jgi:NAD(P)-dependent dehydrogenase (short-subunit alcohol dehydrogenase family)